MQEKDYILKVDYKEEEWEITQDDYVPIISEGYRQRDWVTSTSVKDQMTGEELIDFVNNKLFRVLSGNSVKNKEGEDICLFTKADRPYLIVKEVMRETANFMKNGVLLGSSLIFLMKLTFMKHF